jgi:hypothetical protein
VSRVHTVRRPSQGNKRDPREEKRLDKRDSRTETYLAKDLCGEREGGLRSGARCKFVCVWGEASEREQREAGSGSQGACVCVN